VVEIYLKTLKKWLKGKIEEGVERFCKRKKKLETKKRKGK
jgi:hypothetical protein